MNKGKHYHHYRSLTPCVTTLKKKKLSKNFRVSFFWFSNWPSITRVKEVWRKTSTQNKHRDPQKLFKQSV